MDALQQISAPFGAKLVYHHAHTAQACSHAARLRSFHLRHLLHWVKRRSWITSARTKTNGICITITSRHIPQVRQSLFEARAGVKSGMERWLNAHWNP